MSASAPEEPSVYEALGGADAVLALARAWHERCLADPVVAHAFSHGFRHDHDDRLAAYWVEQLGGPLVFSGRLGDESEVVRMHSGNGEHPEMDRRAVACFVTALDDVGLADQRLRKALTDWFTWAVGEMGVYHHSADDVPDGLPLRRWTWNGPA